MAVATGTPGGKVIDSEPRPRSAHADPPLAELCLSNKECYKHRPSRNESGWQAGKPSCRIPASSTAGCKSRVPAQRRTARRTYCGSILYSPAAPRAYRPRPSRSTSTYGRGRYADAAERVRSLRKLGNSGQCGKIPDSLIGWCVAENEIRRCRRHRLVEGRGDVGMMPTRLRRAYLIRRVVPLMLSRNIMYPFNTARSASFPTCKRPRCLHR